MKENTAHNIKKANIFSKFLNIIEAVCHVSPEFTI